MGINTAINVQISLFDNDFEPDGEDFRIESITQPAVGTVTIVDADNGLVNFSYAAGTPFPGTDFTYTITDSNQTLCPASGKTDMAIVYLQRGSIITNRRITYRVNND